MVTPHGSAPFGGAGVPPTTGAVLTGVHVLATKPAAGVVVVLPLTDSTDWFSAGKSKK